MPGFRDASEALMVLVKRVGFRKASDLMSFLVEWAMAMEANGWEPVDIEQFAEYWQASRATAFRRQQLFRQAYPGESTPSDRILAARAAMLAEKRASEPSPDVLGAAAVMMPSAAA